MTTPVKSDDLAKRSSHVAGVQDFVNQLEVLPASLGDDRLRNLIANTLYRDPSFSNYVHQQVQPVHIVVKNSNVLLTGVVANEIERRQAKASSVAFPGSSEQYSGSSTEPARSLGLAFQLAETDFDARCALQRLGGPRSWNRDSDTGRRSSAGMPSHILRLQSCSPFWAGSLPGMRP